MKPVNVVEILARILVRVGNTDDVAWLKNEIAVSDQTQLLKLFDLPLPMNSVNATVFNAGLAELAQRMRQAGTMEFNGPIKELIRLMQKAKCIPETWTSKQATTVAGQVLCNPENGFRAERAGIHKGLKCWRIVF